MYRGAFTPKNGKSLVFYQTGGTLPPPIKPKKFGNFRFFPGHFSWCCKIFKILIYM